MNVKRNGLEIEFDFRWKNERLRGAIPMDTLADIIRGNGAKSNSNLGPLNKEVFFEDFSEMQYLPRVSKPKKETTYKGEIESVRVLKKFFAGYPIHKISAEDREQFKQDRLSGKLSKSGKPCSHDRINNNLSCLNQILEYAKTVGYIKENPVCNLKRLPSGNRQDKWLRKQQIETLLEVCNGSFRIFVEFLILTGARLNEALMFNDSDFNQSRTDFRLITLKGRKSKGEIFRWLNVNSLGEGFSELRKRMAPHPKTGYFFYNKNGDPLAKSSAEHTFAKIREKIGLVDRRLHDLRHTFAMHRAMSGISFWQLRVEMGHVSAASIQRYLDEAKRYDKTESIFYQKYPQLSIVENEQKRTEKRTEILKNEGILEAIK